MSLERILNIKAIIFIIAIATLMPGMYTYFSKHQTMNRQTTNIKVFQIGFNKAGTTTLSDFFNANQIKSIHYDEGKIAQDMWNNHLKNKPLISREYEQYQAFFDMQNIHTDPPIFIAQTLFKDLDVQYPGSKFILNLRDKDAWIKSRSSHMTKYNMSYLELNAKIYNLTNDEVIAMWSNEWDSHNKEVLEYFKDRPDDLLVFNIEQDPPEKLTAFFSRYFSLDPKLYQHKNKTISISNAA